MALQLTHANTTNDTVSPFAHNNAFGFTAFIRDVDAALIYYPIADDGSIVVGEGEQDAGLTYLFTSIKAVNKLLNCDVKIVLPEHGALTAQEIIDHIDRNITLYCNEVIDSAINVAIKDIADLTAPQTGKDLKQTEKFYEV